MSTESMENLKAVWDDKLCECGAFMREMTTPQDGKLGYECSSCKKQRLIEQKPTDETKKYKVWISKSTLENSQLIKLLEGNPLRLRAMLKEKTYPREEVHCSKCNKNVIATYAEEEHSMSRIYVCESCNSFWSNTIK